MQQNLSVARRPHREQMLRQVLLLSLCATFGACQVDQPTAVRVADGASLAKGGSGGAGTGHGGGDGGGGPSVSSASPSYAHRDTVLDVHVYGAGFSPGAEAAWSLGGDTTQVHVNSTTFLSDSELVANVRVPANAPLASYDVQVTLTDGKKGVGAELFVVTTAQLIGGGIPAASDANDLLQVVGDTYFYDDATGLTDFGSGQVWGVDPQGTLAVGRDAFSVPTAWIRQPSGAFTVEALPNPGGHGGNASSVARATDGTLLVGGWDQIMLTKKSGQNRPAVWRRNAAGSWNTPELYDIPIKSATIYGIAGNGRAVGRTHGSTGVVWDDAQTWTLLDGIPNEINPSGSIAVGSSSGAPAIWWRDPVSNTWSGTAIVLPQLASGSCTGSGQAFSVNDAGVVVGSSCNANGKPQATVWRLDLTTAPPSIIGDAEGLVGLDRPGNDDARAVAITSAAPYVVTGNVVLSGQTVAVRWVIP